MQLHIKIHQNATFMFTVFVHLSATAAAFVGQ